MAMMQKKCLDCKKISYSSVDSYAWICPHCGTDMTMQKAIPAEHDSLFERSHFVYLFHLSEVKGDTNC